MLLECESTETNEVRAISLASPAGEPELLQPRRLGHRYYPEHRGDRWYILTNRNEKINFDLVSAPVASSGEDEWVPVKCLPSAGTHGSVGAFEWSEHRTLESITAFENYLVLEGREGGFSAVWVLELEKSESESTTTADGDSSAGFEEKNEKKPAAAAAAIAKWHKTEWPSQNCCVYTAVASSSLGCVGANQIFSAEEIFISYMSLTTPKTVYRYNMRTGEKRVVKATPVNGFDASKYDTMRTEVTVRDGTKVPVSIAFRKDLRKRNGPMLLSGYGSYGVSNDPSFSREDIPLMDRGVVIAVAHIRGGGEMGRYWYEKEGKYLKKKNTFNDFVDVAEHLAATGWTSPANLAITGRSAGGLLVGNAVNMKPELFRCAVAAVPFVDMMVSMCDPSIPLTTGEWEEWGNPNEEKYYEYMLSYGPMENINFEGTPNGTKPEVLVTSGLHDPRVAYWEGAKYAARLRDAASASASASASGGGGSSGGGCESQSSSRVLLKTDLTAGHFSATDRYHYFRERAYEHGFVLDSLGLCDAKPSWMSDDAAAEKKK